MRLKDAQIGFVIAQHIFKESKVTTEKLGEIEIPDHFDRGAFGYIVTASLVVYCVSLFDVFLSDLTRVLLFNNIAALGKSCVVPIEVLASSTARIEIIKKEVEKRVRTVSYKSFEERVEFLQTIFGLSFRLDEEEKSILRRISNLRNRIVHDQSVNLLDIDQELVLSLRAKADPKSPVPVEWEDINNADRLFIKLSKRIIHSVCADVLRVKIQKL